MLKAHGIIVFAFDSFCHRDVRVFDITISLSQEIVNYESIFSSFIISRII